MAFLVLTDDEVALLRFTCDLFFVEESPLYFLEVEQREPGDFESAYQKLLDKKVVDPTAFRVTDEALNRVAPITECDARIVQVTQKGNEEAEQLDYYLLDEIAVQYADGETGHVMGQDMDQDELVDYLGRRLVPRKSTGDVLNASLTPVETVALAILTSTLRKGNADTIPISELAQLLGNAPQLRPTSVAHDDEDTALFSVLGVRTLDQGAADDVEPIARAGLVDDQLWDHALGSLLEQGLFRKRGDALAPSLALSEFIEGLGNQSRHTLVRYDFSEDEWMLRETTFVPVEGGLFWVGLQPDGLVGIRELDGRALFKALHEAIGPLPRVEKSPDPLPMHHLVMRRV